MLPVIFAPAAEALITALVTVAVKKLIDDERESRPYLVILISGASYQTD